MSSTPEPTPPSTRRPSMASRRSEEHTSELQYRCISYAVFCLKKKTSSEVPQPRRRLESGPPYERQPAAHRVYGRRILSQLEAALADDHEGRDRDRHHRATQTAS